MKTRIKYIILALFIPLMMNGQALKSSYFLDNSTNRHTLNPALAPIQGYVGMPGLSSFGVNLKGDFGASSFLFPLENGGLGTFLHPEVSSDQFLDRLNKMTGLDFNFNYDLMSMGWNRGESTFWTVDLGIRLNVNSSIPRDFFSLLKNGMSSASTNYSIENFAFSQDAYTQVAVGYSRDLKIVNGLRVGGKLKVLVGIDKAEVAINSLDINMSADKWAISADAHAKILGKGVDFVEDKDGKVTSFKLDPGAMGVGGFGVAIDLGAEYRFPEGTLLNGLAFSASVTDLGFISYSAANARLAEVDNSFTFDGIDGLDISNMDVSGEFDQIQKEIFGLISLKETDLEKGMTQMLAAKIYLGAEYSFLKDKMSVGLLYSAEFGPLISRNELTLAYSLNPTDWFGFVASYSFINTHKSIGWLLNFTPRRGINFFVGSDYTILSFTPQYLPVDNAYLNLQFGISFPIGHKNIRGREYVR